MILLVGWLVPFGALAASTHCSPTSMSQADSPALDEPFSLRVGESSEIADTDLLLTFVEVPQDSRCPEDVNCIVAGEAIVVFEARSSGERQELTFEVPPGGSDFLAHAEFTVSIQRLEPPTKAGEPIDPSSYVAELVVARRGS